MKIKCAPSVTSWVQLFVEQNQKTYPQCSLFIIKHNITNVERCSSCGSCDPFTALFNSSATSHKEFMNADIPTRPSSSHI